MIYLAVASKLTERGFLKVGSKTVTKLKPNDWVEVETELGRRAFKIIRSIERPTKDQTEHLIGTIVNRLSREKLDRVESFAPEEEEMLKVFKERVKKYDLEMKPIEAIKTVDQDRIIFFFTAPERVDFRRLVKDLATTFHKLIRLQQINQRTAAMIKGGIGPCGRTICCRSLSLAGQTEVRSDIISRQGLQGVDSSKLSGLCGKLVCCLKFEEEQYKELTEKMPKMGEKIKIKEEGFGEVIDIKPLKGTVLVKLAKDRVKEVKV